MIIKKSAAEIEAMKEAGRISAKVLREVGALVKPGVSTLVLDEFAEALIRLEGGIPAFKGLRWVSLDLRFGQRADRAWHSFIEGRLESRRLSSPSTRAPSSMGGLGITLGPMRSVRYRPRRRAPRGD